MVQILEPVKRQPDLLSRFADAMQAGVQSGTQFAGSYYGQKAEQDAQRAKEQQKRLGQVTLTNLDRWLGAAKNTTLPKDKFKYLQEAQNLLGENPDMSPEEAFILAISGKDKESFGDQFNQEEEPKKRFQSQYKGGIIDLLRGTAEKRPEDIALAQEPKAGLMGFLGGLSEFGGIKSPQDRAIEYLQNLEKNPEQQLAEKEGKRFGGLLNALAIPLPAIGIVGAGLEKLKKVPVFEKIISRLAKAVGAPEEAIAAKALESAEAKGIDLGKVSQGDLSETNKFLKNTAQISKEFPKGPAQRIEKVAEKRPVFKEKEAKALREKELEMFPEYKQEAEAYEAERYERRNRVKRAETIAREEDRMQVAAKEYPKAKADYERLAGQVRALEDEVAKLPSSQRGRVESLLKYTERELAVAEQNLLDTHNIMRTGEIRSGIKEMEQKAVEKINKISSEIEAGKEPRITKADFNPERIAEAKKLAKLKKPLPSRMKPYDKLFQAHEVYKTAYKKRLAQIDGELAALKEAKSLGDAKMVKSLQKEKELFNNLVNHLDADLKLHEHQLNLRNLLSRQKAEKVFRKLKPGISTATQEKARKVFKETPKESKQTVKKAEEFVRNPSPEKAEEVAAKAKVTPEQAEKATVSGKKQAKNLWDDLLGSGKVDRFKREWKELVDRLMNGDYKAFYQTPMGRAILANAVSWGFEEATGKKIPFAASLATLFARSPSYQLVTIGTRLMRKAVDEVAEEANKKKYVDAIRENRQADVKRIGEKLSKKNKSKALQEALQ